MDQENVTRSERSPLGDKFREMAAQKVAGTLVGGGINDEWKAQARHQRALELAVQSVGPGRGEDRTRHVLERAEAFEKFLRDGGAS